MVKHIGKRAFRAQVDPLGDGENFAESARKIHCSWTGDEPTCALPNRPIGSGKGPLPLPVVQAVPGAHPGYPGAVNAAGLTHR